MPTDITIRAIDRSTFIIDVAFSDENDEAITPNEVEWSLLSETGAIINDREEVEVSSLNTTISIVLTGEDLDFADGRVRVLLIEATYNSDLGTNLALRETARFLIDNLPEPA